MTRAHTIIPRNVMRASGVVFIGLAISEILNGLTPGLEWVLPTCAVAYLLSCAWVAVSLIRPARPTRSRDA